MCCPDELFAFAFELHAVAAAVLGGCSLQGGKGTVFGVLIGAGILQITFNAVNLVGQSLWQNVVAGGVILTAVIVDRLFEKSRGFGGAKKTTPTSTSTTASASATTTTAPVAEGQS